MKISQLQYSGESWNTKKEISHGDLEKLILVFGDRLALQQEQPMVHLRDKFPNSQIISVSTSGDIIGTFIAQAGDLIATAIELEHSTFQIHRARSIDYTDFEQLGKDLASSFQTEGLKHVVVFSEGTGVNGSFLIEGINKIFRNKISVTGGLAGDGNRFQETSVGLNGNLSPYNVVAIGFYGETLKIGFGHECAFESFGPSRKITKSQDNVLYEIDGKPALSLYRNYLGKNAEYLPESALWFPLEISKEGIPKTFVRTILSIDEEKNTMTFAGNVPEGSYIRLMRSNTEDILASAENSAQSSNVHKPFTEGFALLISCVGRRSILKERCDEELEEVRAVLPENMIMSGFYSYRELSSEEKLKGCDLYNQTMTITTICEDTK